MTSLATLRSILPGSEDLSDDTLLSIAKQHNYKVDVPEPSDKGDLSRGFTNSFTQAKQLGYGLVGAAGATAENEFGYGGLGTAARKWGVAGYDKAANEIESKPSDDFDYSWTKAHDEGDFGALVDMAQYGIGQGLGQGVQLAGSALLGGGLGGLTLRGFAEHSAATLVAKEAAQLESKYLAATGATALDDIARNEIKTQAVKNVAKSIGTNATIGASAVGMEAGEIGGGLASDATAKGHALTGEELARGFGATLLAAAPEFVSDKLTLGLAKAGTGGILGRAAKGAAVNAPVEAGTEFGQTLAEEYGKGKDWTSPESMSSARTGAFMGAMGGGTMGAIAGAVSPRIESPALPPVPTVNVDEVLTQTAEPIQRMGADIASMGSVDDAIAASNRQIQDIIAQTRVPPPVVASEPELETTPTPDTGATDEPLTTNPLLDHHEQNQKRLTTNDISDAEIIPTAPTQTLSPPIEQARLGYETPTVLPDSSTDSARNAPAVGSVASVSDVPNEAPQEIIGKGSTGNIYRDGDEAVKTSTRNEAKVYSALRNIEGIAKGYEKDGNIRTPIYKKIVSVDTIADKDRKSLAPLISKNVKRINSAVSALTSAGYKYSDPLQFGLTKDNSFDLMDFSMAEEGKGSDLISDNLAKLSGFYKQFGLPRQAASVSTVSDVIYGQHDYASNGKNELLGHEYDGANYRDLTDMLDGKPASYAYYTTNGRHVNLKGTAQTDNIGENKTKVILSNRMLTEKEIDAWELTPVLIGKPINVPPPTPQQLARLKPRKRPIVHENDDILTAVAKLGGLSANEAKAQGIDPRSFKDRGHGILRIFHNSPTSKTYDHMAEVLRGHGFDVSGANDLVDKISRAVNQREKIYTPTGYENAAKIAGEHKLDQDEYHEFSRVSKLLDSAAYHDEDFGTNYHHEIQKLIDKQELTDDELSAWERDLYDDREYRRTKAQSARDSKASPESPLGQYSESDLRDRAAEQSTRAAKTEKDTKQAEVIRADKAAGYDVFDEMMGNTPSTNDVFGMTNPLEKVVDDTNPKFSMSDRKKIIKRLEKENRSTIPKIPSGNVFHNQVDNVSPEVRFKADDAFEKNTNVKKETVNLKDIIPTQKNITTYNLESADGSKDSPDLIKSNGKYYVVDGHHRIANAILNGESSVDARVFSDSESSKLSKSSAPTVSQQYQQILNQPLKLKNIKITIDDGEGNTVRVKATDIINKHIPQLRDTIDQYKQFLDCISK